MYNYAPGHYKLPKSKFTTPWILLIPISVAGQIHLQTHWIKLLHRYMFIISPIPSIYLLLYMSLVFTFSWQQWFLVSSLCVSAARYDQYCVIQQPKQTSMHSTWQNQSRTPYCLVTSLKTNIPWGLKSLVWTCTARRWTHNGFVSLTIKYNADINLSCCCFFFQRDYSICGI